MRIDFGSVTLTDDALRHAREDVRVSFYNSINSLSSIHGEVYLEMTDETAADLFAALAEYLPLRLDAREEERVQDILSNHDTPD